MIYLHLVRHGETKWNVKKKIQGWKDSALTPAGEIQARQLAKQLSPIKFDTIFSSTSTRALDTARILASGIPVKKDKDLREMNLGTWEGKTFDQVAQNDPDQLDAFWHRPSQYRPQEGESFARLQERAVLTLNRIANEKNGKNILIVTHTIFIKTLLAYHEQQDIDRIWNPPNLGNCSHSIVVKDENQHFYVSQYCDQTGTPGLFFSP